MGKKSKRYCYTTVGYGVFSLLGECYRMGRIEEHDTESETGYATDEGTYCIPFDVVNKFEDFIESLESDLPLSFNFGSVDRCSSATSEKLGIPKDKLHDEKTQIEYFRKKKLIIHKI
jgi:hypothetical protein